MTGSDASPATRILRLSTAAAAAISVALVLGSLVGSALSMLGADEASDLSRDAQGALIDGLIAAKLDEVALARSAAVEARRPALRAAAARAQLDASQAVMQLDAAHRWAFGTLPVAAGAGTDLHGAAGDPSIVVAAGAQASVTPRDDRSLLDALIAARAAALSLVREQVAFDPAVDRVDRRVAELDETASADLHRLRIRWFGRSSPTADQSDSTGPGGREGMDSP